ncbi:hypothetical protein G7Y89_g12348 [Cudoniella acicularis]|uniref:Xylanolytic transcriptional activator regulatory domain-containing protein n=1 Tax=Cudoniella acicularis TaxID=354080 RepID=A0A8H4RAL4_9HELO|nr:hypothetical protein G7Y89_g12348 [Cudoniella acicularis]
MSFSPQTQKSGLPRAKRLKISIACQSCRSKKVKCDGIRPGIVHPEKHANAGPATDTSLYQRAAIATSAEQLDGHDPRGVYCSSIPAVFAGEVRTAIDARFGLPPAGRPSLIPMTDAPLFGLLCPRQVIDSSLHQVDNVLPPRKHADHLMDIYWKHLHPLEPILDQEHFSHSYQALFAGNSLDDDEDENVFLSSLNMVFALSTQVQEALRAEQREEASNAYFHRAWRLLRPETIIWEPGSLGVVQCLLLMSRYLQCTNNPHQTWMAMGSAVRIAQSIGLHIPEASSSQSRNSRRRRQLWQCCVFMDRGISWVFGRNSMASLTVSPASIDSLYDNDLEGQPGVPSAQYFTKMLELYEIANHIMLSQMPACGNLGDRLGLPRLYQNDEYFNTVLQLDACLNKWEKNNHQLLTLEIPQGDVDVVLQIQGVILRLRLLHGRILLFRPMLARLCLSHSQVAPGSALDHSLVDRLLPGFASLCIDSAQKMIALVHEQQKPDGTIGILPWWHRVFYLHVAGTILIAAMLRADLFTPTVSQSWSKAMSALRAHEYLSPFVQQCVATFQTLSSKISGTHHPGGGSGQFGPPEGSSNTYFQDVFQDMGFDPDNFLFGKEDMSWLSNFESTQ